MYSRGFDEDTQAKIYADGQAEVNIGKTGLRFKSLADGDLPTDPVDDAPGHSRLTKIVPEVQGTVLGPALGLGNGGVGISHHGGTTESEAPIDLGDQMTAAHHLDEIPRTGRLMRTEP